MNILLDSKEAIKRKNAFKKESFGIKNVHNALSSSLSEQPSSLSILWASLILRLNFLDSNFLAAFGDNGKGLSGFLSSNGGFL